MCSTTDIDSDYFWIVSLPEIVRLFATVWLFWLQTCADNPHSPNTANNSLTKCRWNLLITSLLLYSVVTAARSVFRFIFFLCSYRVQSTRWNGVVRCVIDYEQEQKIARIFFLLRYRNFFFALKMSTQPWQRHFLFHFAADKMLLISLRQIYILRCLALKAKSRSEWASQSRVCSHATVQMYPLH